MHDVADGVRRVTFRLPLGIDHVHCYFLRAGDGTWTLVDTGLGRSDPEGVWAPILAELDGPVERIVVTHLHPDHIGGSADIAALTGARVLQGRLDHEQAVGAWGASDAPERSAAHLVEHGMPAAHGRELAEQGRLLRERVRLPEGPELLDEGDRVGGWEVLELPGHADGHIALLRDGILVAGDTVLGRITPTVGLYQQSRPDPLGDYLTSLARIASLAPQVAFAGHEQPIEDVPRRVAELERHHAQRLDEAHAALDRAGRSGYELSLALFDPGLPLVQRRFALAETLAHPERIVAEGRAARVERDGRPLYRRA
jgi:glyoxylase-like metal-dependent hydrolase (beta-lactamase superfamily II)